MAQSWQMSCCRGADRHASYRVVAEVEKRPGAGDVGGVLASKQRSNEHARDFLLIQLPPAVGLDVPAPTNVTRWMYLNSIQKLLLTRQPLQQQL